MAVAPTNRAGSAPVEEWFGPGGAARFITGAGGLWLGFAVVHVLVSALALLGTGMPLGDVTLVYKLWAERAVADHFIVGIDSGWVYPIVALVPILAASFLGFPVYEWGWLTLVVALNAAAFAFLVHPADGRRRHAAWWWLGFLVLLGPIAVGRIDAITVPLVVVALLQLAARPRTAALILTAAMWVKVWPAAVVAAVVVSVRQRWQVLVTVVVASIGVIALALLAGAGGNVFSFVGQQTGRGLQIEAPVSAPWLWLGAFHRAGAGLYYDNDMLTFQVVGPGVGVAAGIMTPLMAAAVLAVLWLGYRASRRGCDAAALLPVFALALVTALIAFNKVGSPQFVSWLAVPVIAGLVTAPRRYLVPAVLVTLVAALTQVVYPYWYGYLLNLDAPMVAVLTARNILYLVVLGWAVRELWRAPAEAETRL